MLEIAIGFLLLVIMLIIGVPVMYCFGAALIFCSMKGLFNVFVELFGGEPFNFLMETGLFRTIYIGSGIWQEVGWGSIIYLAALTSIDSSLYEAARMDGAGRFKQMLHITLPGIMPTIVIMLILRMGQVMNVGFEKIYLLQTDLNKAVSDTIAVYVYEQGILGAEYSYSTAIGLFNTAVNIVLLIVVSRIAKKASDVQFV